MINAIAVNKSIKNNYLLKKKHNRALLAHHSLVFDFFQQFSYSSTFVKKLTVLLDLYSNLSIDALLVIHYVDESSTNKYFFII